MLVHSGAASGENWVEFASKDGATKRPELFFDHAVYADPAAEFDPVLSLDFHAMPDSACYGCSLDIIDIDTETYTAAPCFTLVSGHMPLADLPEATQAQAGLLTCCRNLGKEPFVLPWHGTKTVAAG